MPHTVNIERQKLDQAMHQKLKRYIMIKRKREFEEKAQDAYFKRLKHEREERNRQTELDTENLENTKKEILSARKRLEDLTSRRNELFQRLKQLASEETSLKEKQKSETLAYLSGMPSTQFGLEPSNMGSANCVSVTHGSLVSSMVTPHQQIQQNSSLGVKSGIGNGINIPILSHNLPSNILNDSVHRNIHNSNLVSNSNNNVNKNLHTQTTSSTVQAGVPQQNFNSLAAHPNMAALAAAVVAQQRAISSSDSTLSPSAAAYINAIASLSGNSLGVGYPNASSNFPANFAEIVAALTASDMYPLPASSLSTNLTQANNANMLNLAFGSKSSPSNTEGTFNPHSSASLANALNYHQSPQQQQQQQQQSKNPSSTSHHASTDPNIDTAKVCLTQLAAVAAALAAGAVGAVNNPSASNNQQHQIQKAYQILRSFSGTNPLMPSLITSNASDLDSTRMISPIATSTSVSSNSLLPPAPISYRGSITTGQSAQQIQLQQQAHQKQQQQQLSKYSSQTDFAVSRSSFVNQNTDVSRFTNQQLYPNNLIMLNLTTTSSHTNLTNSAIKPSSGSRSSEGGNNSANPSSVNLTSTSTTTSSLSSVSATAGLASYTTELNPLNYLTTATLAAAFQQQQQQMTNKILSSSNNNNNNTSSTQSMGSNLSGLSNISSSANNYAGRRFF